MGWCVWFGDFEMRAFFFGKCNMHFKVSPSRSSQVCLAEFKTFLRVCAFFFFFFLEKPSLNLSSHHNNKHSLT